MLGSNLKRLNIVTSKNPSGASEITRVSYTHV